MVELTRKTNVMMSFSVEDTRRVDQLLKHLAKYNIPYFEFRRGIEPGQDIIVSVLNAIDLCTHVFIYVSPASVNSPWVWFEVGIGTALGRSLVFVLDHPSTKLPLPFNHLRYVINDKEYVDYVRTLGRMGTPIKSGQNISLKASYITMKVVGQEQFDSGVPRT